MCADFVCIENDLGVIIVVGFVVKHCVSCAMHRDKIKNLIAVHDAFLCWFVLFSIMVRFYLRMIAVK